MSRLNWALYCCPFIDIDRYVGLGIAAWHTAWSSLCTGMCTHEHPTLALHAHFACAYLVVRAFWTALALAHQTAPLHIRPSKFNGVHSLDMYFTGNFGADVTGGVPGICVLVLVACFWSRSQCCHVLNGLRHSTLLSLWSFLAHVPRG